MDPIIDVSDLVAALTTPEPPVVLDIRWKLAGPPGRPEYEAGHLPGAHYLDLDTELAGPPGPHGRHPLPDLGVFQAAMRRAGVDADRDVAVYDAGDGTSAARAWWMLRWTGHRAVRVLDGGLRAWAAAGLRLEQGVPPAGDGNFTVEPGGMPVLTADEAARLARSRLLLDARTAERYRGETEPIDPVAGHIPGAVSAPTTNNLEADGRWKPPAELAARFAALGVGQGTAVGVYCGSGVTAAHQVLALARVRIPAALYLGSWSEWCTNQHRPVATGAEPG